jgi:hypothetical protein
VRLARGVVGARHIETSACRCAMPRLQLEEIESINRTGQTSRDELRHRRRSAGSSPLSPRKATAGQCYAMARGGATRARE